jgi:hypothetical protein
VRAAPHRKLRALGVVLAAVVLASSSGAAVPPPHRTAISSTRPGVRHPVPAPQTRGRPPARAAVPATGRSVHEQAYNARLLEDAGAYGGAVAALRALRARGAPDGDLELALALDEARTGQPDSALARLEREPLRSALTDSLPIGRRHDYPWDRENEWTNGRFDGWNWYVARARAEVDAGLGRWHVARQAAEVAVAARPLAGKEWLLLAVCAGRDGDPGAAETAATRATALDPTLPEARYLAGLFAWRGGRRAAAQSEFRAAVALDSSYRAPAIALVRSRLPGTAPDSLPAEFLTGVREVGMLTSPMGPKLEEFVQMDTPATILKREMPPATDSSGVPLPPVEITLPMLVDERGRAVLHDLPWFSPTDLSATAVGQIIGSLPDWRFTPARRLGAPRRVWAAVLISNRKD